MCVWVCVFASLFWYNRVHDNEARCCSPTHMHTDSQNKDTACVSTTLRFPQEGEERERKKETKRNGGGGGGHTRKVGSMQLMNQIRERERERERKESHSLPPLSPFLSFCFIGAQTTHTTDALGAQFFPFRFFLNPSAASPCPQRSPYPCPCRSSTSGPCARGWPCGGASASAS